MCEGEFESLKAIYAVSPDFVPKPYSWGKYNQTDIENPAIYFLLAEFRNVGQQVREEMQGFSIEIVSLQDSPCIIDGLY
jgi:protein-ribulosamine 3-kinase